MTTSTKLSVLPLEAHKRNGVDVGAICWGSCGKGLVGGTDLGNGDVAIPCATPANKCPAFDAETSEPWGTVNDGQDPNRVVYLRKIKQPWRTIKPPLRERARKVWLAVRWSPWTLRNALREWWTPTCRTCCLPMKAHKPKPEPGGRVLMRAPWDGYGGVDHVRAVEFSGGILFAVESVSCAGEVDSVLLLESDVESLRDALDEALARDEVSDGR